MVRCAGAAGADAWKPSPAVWLLLATVWVVLLVMIAMLALEIVILVQVFDLVDLIEKLVPGG